MLRSLLTLFLARVVNMYLLRNQKNIQNDKISPLRCDRFEKRQLTKFTVTLGGVTRHFKAR